MQWIESLKNAWLHKDIDAVLGLFTDDAEYFETPFQKVPTNDLPELWSAILTQENVELNIERLVSEGAQHVVRWGLTYNRGNDVSDWAGLYIVRLNEAGKCEYFYQVGEKA